MGILDDAIREHLDLKRRLGAEDDELARLEDEAFGPPSRPGDPDFPTDQPTGEAAVAEPPTGEASTAPETAEPPSEEVAAQAPPTEAPSEELPVEAPSEPTPEPEPEAEAAAPPTAEEPAVAEPDSGGFYDQSDELDLELDLDLDDVGEEERAPPAPEPVAPEPPPEGSSAVPETADQPAVEPAPAPPPADEAPIESLDTVEHHFEEAIEDTGEAEVVEGELADEPEADAEGDAGSDDEDEDVLEETPEFLRDAPEDDELWFEQGEPKDFDF